MRSGILAAGNWILDRVKRIDRWPGEGNLCNILEETRSGGGGPCNVLFDLAAMDPTLELYAAGRTGDDDDGEFLHTELRARNIDARFMTRSSSAPTSYTDVMSGGGKRTFFHCRGANAELCFEELDRIDVPGCFFYLGYLLLLDALDAPDPRYGTVAARLLHTMRERGFRTVADFVTEAPEKFRMAAAAALPQLDILIINELEASHATGIELRTHSGKLRNELLFETLEKLLNLGVRELAVIHYPEGAAALARSGEFRSCPSFELARERIVGTNGAGDAFAAGILYALHEGAPLKYALELASASSYCNLLSPTASGGAASLSTLENLIAAHL